MNFIFPAKLQKKYQELSCLRIILAEIVCGWHSSVPLVNESLSALPAVSDG